jgi:molecular chaperone Hsp33
MILDIFSNRLIRMTNSDFIKPFLINNLSIHGKIVHLEESVSEVISKHNYPSEISNILAELLVFVSMMGHNLKSKAILTCQITSNDAIISLLVADYVFNENNDANIRAYAEFDENKLNLSLDRSFSFLLTNAKMIITIDMLGEAGARYQGVVDFNGASLVDALSEYFTLSQQIDAKFKIAVSREDDKWIAGGIMIQRFPGEDIDSWNKASIFLDTISEDEVLLEKISSEILLHRLFHEDDVYLYEDQDITHKCRCSREKMEKSLSTMPDSELESLKINQIIAIKCQFCGKEENF